MFVCEVLVYVSHGRNLSCFRVARFSRSFKHVHNNSWQSAEKEGQERWRWWIQWSGCELKWTGLFECFLFLFLLLGSLFCCWFSACFRGTSWSQVAWSEQCSDELMLNVYAVMVTRVYSLFLFQYLLWGGTWAPGENPHGENMQTSISPKWPKLV